MITTIFPIEALALTGGPSQPEVQSFSPIGVSDMVDPATGDFSYNIPLLEVGGYPINLIYNAGVTMDQEASTVGLGWNINPGVISRTVRGIPDDFKGDQIGSEFNLKENWTIGVNAGIDLELFGANLTKAKISPSLGLFYNNYKGPGFEFGVSPSISAGNLLKTPMNANLGFNLNFNSSTGNSFKPSLSFSSEIKQSNKQTKNRTKKKSKFFKKVEGLKNDKASFSPNLSFSDPSYVPPIQFPMKNLSLSANFSFMAELFGSAPGMRFGGYFTTQKLKTKNQNKPAFGVLYADQSNRTSSAMLDFNREKDVGFSKDITNLPLSQFTSDVFSLSGQGIGGAYKIKRGDVGIIYDNQNSNTASGGSLGFEAGPGNLVRLGGNFHANGGNTTTGLWSQNFNVFNNLDFYTYDPSSIGYEPAYFKAVNEPNIEELNESKYEGIGKNRPVAIKLNNSNEVEPLLEYKGDVDILNPIKRTEREKRNQSISYLTAEQASLNGLVKVIQDYPLNEGLNTAQPQSIDRDDGINGDRKPHHISEITAVRPDGLRYVYGIPAYNLEKKEVSFNADLTEPIDCEKNIIGYSSTDASTGNINGVNNFYSKTETPAYAHSYLLTAILSDDYSDLTGDGPTPDDLGSYTKINYTRLHSGYKWRMPYESALYNKGLNSDADDDKASYTYGRKEIWLTHSIESKTQLAEFYYGRRHDGRGVLNEEGGPSNNLQMQKLEKIILYSRPDRLKQTGNPYEPIKSVHFEYNYSLCKGVNTNDGLPYLQNNINYPNEGGKLTLKKVYFKNGRSQKGRFSPYFFNYSDVNPTYNSKAYNRWGTYQPINVTWDSDNPNCTITGDLNTSDFPYIRQDERNNKTAKQWADENASAWNLSDITLPSGAKIHVDYEADDYGYVQEKGAMQMIEIVQTSNTLNLTSEPNFGSKLDLFNGSIPHNYIFFKLHEEVDASTQNEANAIIRDKYLRDITTKGNLYFKVLARITNEEEYEYVSGYYDLDEMDPYGAIKLPGSTKYNYGYIQLKTACTKDRESTANGSCTGLINTEVNPISKAVWQFTRLNLPKKILGEFDINGSDNEDQMRQVLELLANSFDSFLSFFNGGYNNKLKNEGYGQKIIKGKSWIRLYNPIKKKLGGTHRVSRITISDSWADMTGGLSQNSTYGQEYIYTTDDFIGSEKVEISSGVAAYEPIVGGDENPYREPDFYVKENKLAPDDNHYLEKPYGESFFPSPNVVYSHVKVQNLQYDNVTFNATGYTVNEFYTAKDFPTFTRKTTAQQKRKRTNPILKILKISNKDHLTASQGYVVELNDMHGKPKETSVYNQWGSKISGIAYQYKNNGQKRLVNTVKTINRDGEVNEAYLGLEYEMIADTRESKTKSTGGGVDLNNDNFLVGVFPIIAIVPLISFSTEKTQYRSVVLTKVIRRNGILEKSIAYDLGSSVETNNLYYDHETGAPLVTQTFNEFEDPIFNFNFPSHWAYEGMQSAYQNIGARIELSGGTNGIYTSSIPSVFTPGDELINLTGQKAWVLTTNGTSAFMIDENGNAFSGAVGTYTINRSGHRNRSSESIGTITSLKNPIVTNQLEIDAQTEVINSSMVEFHEKRFVDCCEELPVEEYCVCDTVTTGSINHQDLLIELLQTANFQLPHDFSSFENSSTDSYEFKHKDEQVIPFNILNQLSQIVNYPQSNCSGNLKMRETDVYRNGGYFYTNLEFGVDFSNENCHCKIRLTGIPEDFSELNIVSTNPDPIKCENNAIEFTGYTISGSLSAPVNGGFIYTECYDFSINCGFQQILIGNQNSFDHPINPFVQNLKGTYKPKKSFTFLTNRKKTITHPDLSNLQKDGSYQNFSSFWQKNPVDELWRPNDLNWTWTSEITKVTQNGNEVESRDPLSRYNAQLLGYYDQLVTAVSNNARYNYIGFDGFEDYHYNATLEENANQCEKQDHFKFDVPLSLIQNDNVTAHTGNYYLKLEAGDVISQTYVLNGICDLADNRTNSSDEESLSLSTEFKIDSCDCIGRFNPSPGKYILSAWVYQGLNPTNGQAADAGIKIYNQTGLIGTFNGAQTPIEGWQRVYGVFDLPTGSNEIKIELLNTSSTDDVGFDDLRIHPFDASFKSYVYDDITLKFTYELDENNYFTQYEYSPDGQLERIKKETERGIMMIQESRFGQQKRIGQ